MLAHVLFHLRAPSVLHGEEPVSTDTLEYLSNALMKLNMEGWKLSEILHGNVRMFREVDAAGQLQCASGTSLTAALAFGLLPEIRIASRRASHCQDRLKVRRSVVCTARSTMHRQQLVVAPCILCSSTD